MILVKSLLMCLLLALPLLGARAASPVCVEARRILANARDTRYQHKTVVDESAGQYHLDCSGLAAVILRRAWADAFRAVEKADRVSHPRAFAYHDIFASAATNAPAATNGWVRVVRVADLRPGDFIAWRRAALKAGDSTGHVMIADQAPVREECGDWRVVIIDSTTRRHAADTRAEGSDGVGRGTIWMTADAEGRPAGVRLRAPSDRPRTGLPIAMGRVAGTD